MPDDALCPWCGSAMKLNEPVKDGQYYYICRKCGATGPMHATANRALYAVMSQRRTPAIILTPHQINSYGASTNETAVYIETRGGKLFPAIIYMDEYGQSHLDTTARYSTLARRLLDNYGTYWRAWNKYPTIEERERAAWR